MLDRNDMGAMKMKFLLVFRSEEDALKKKQKMTEAFIDVGQITSHRVKKKKLSGFFHEKYQV